MPIHKLTNPFRPGAGHMPPYLAGREKEIAEFRKLLEQETILENLILTGLRGVGKTVLLETLKPIAIGERWRWVGTDLSESASVSELTMARRLLTDLAPLTSGLTVRREEMGRIGFAAESTTFEHKLTYANLEGLFESTPGLVSDKLKCVLEFVWQKLSEQTVRGLIFAYDEAQNMSDRPAKEQYPLSMLLDVFQSIQRKGIPLMLALTGLPTLFPRLVEARTFSERMFRVVVLDRLDRQASRDAITKPIENEYSSLHLTDDSIDQIVDDSAGYPYFIQFICREVFDAALQQVDAGETPFVPMADIMRKLDADFFAGRWAKATDRQRDLLTVIANLEHSDGEFTVQEVVELSQEISVKKFGPSHVNQMLQTLSNLGLVYKNRYGKYSFAVPLFGQFILRQTPEGRED